MVRIVSKQAQYLSVRNDAAVVAPGRPVGRFVRNKVRQIQDERKRRQWGSYYDAWEKMRDAKNGPCPICKRDLAKDTRGKVFCPDPSCSSPQHRFTQPRMTY